MAWGKQRRNVRTERFRSGVRCSRVRSEQEVGGKRMTRTGRRCGSIMQGSRATVVGAVFFLSSALGIMEASAAPTLLLNADMEGEAVVPSGNQAYDIFLLKMPSGEPGALAIQYEGGTILV